MERVEMALNSMYSAPDLNLQLRIFQRFSRKVTEVKISGVNMVQDMAYSLLKGKKGIIFGALNDMSIAWKVAVKAHEEGARFTLTNTPVALRLGTLDELAEKTGSKVLPADATNVAADGTRSGRRE